MMAERCGHFASPGYILPDGEGAIYPPVALLRGKSPFATRKDLLHRTLCAEPRVGPKSEMATTRQLGLEQLILRVEPSLDPDLPRAGPAEDRRRQPTRREPRRP